MKKATGESVLISQLIHTFLSVYVPFQQGQSENTRKSHETALSLYIGYLENVMDIKPETLDSGCFGRDMVESWLLWLRDSRGCAPETCNVRLASIRAFLKYLGGKEVSMLHLSNAASGIPRMRETKKKVSGMSRRAVQALMAAPNTSTATGRRDLALIVAIYGTASRLDEILSLKVKQLHLYAKSPYVTIIGKGGKIRSLYLLPKAAAHLQRHLAEFHGDSPDPEAYVFYSRNKGRRGKLSQTAVDNRLKMHASIAHNLCDDVPLGIHAHQLRHAMATHWLEDGLNIIQISLLLGHEQIQTTMAYLDISFEQKAEALSTLEEDSIRNTPKKWKANGSLSAFCGLNPIAQ